MAAGGVNAFRIQKIARGENADIAQAGTNTSTTKLISDSPKGLLTNTVTPATDLIDCLAVRKVNRLSDALTALFSLYSGKHFFLLGGNSIAHETLHLFLRVATEFGPLRFVLLDTLSLTLDRITSRRKHLSRNKNISCGNARFEPSGALRYGLEARVWCGTSHRQRIISMQASKVSMTELN